MQLPPLVEPVAALSDAERARTARHRSLAALGEIGQRRLRAAHVAVVGAGGLGSPIILALSAAGIGAITVIDDDVVEATNLQRQVLHRRTDIGEPKVASAIRAAADLSPETTIVPIRERLTATNAARLLAGADVVVDGTDTFDTREAVAAACEQLGVPLVWGTVQAFDAQATVFWSAPPAGIRPLVLSDLYPTGSTGELPSCSDVGVLGALCLQVGSLLATETVKLITGIGETLFGRVLVIDGLRARQREVVLRPALAAPVVAPTRPEVGEIDARSLGQLLETGAAPSLLDVREPDELVVSGALPGVVNVPLAAVLADPGAVGGPVVVICQVGRRARRAAEALVGAGVEAIVLAGGMDAWDAAHAPAAASAHARATR